MITYIHYRETDGEIFGWESSTENEPPPRKHLDFSCIGVLSFVPDPKLHKIIGKEVVDKTSEETSKANLPTMIEIQSLIYSELASTDGHMAPDRPLSSQKRAQWSAYRQHLRDLSKPQDIKDVLRLPTPMEMVSEWPLRPDGSDPIPNLRLKKAK